MAVQAWRWYNLAVKKVGNGTINLAATTFRIALFTSASNFATLTLGLLGSVTNQVTEANGYSSSGKALTNEVWTAGASAGQYKFDADDVFWSANGGTIPNIKGAVLFTSGASAGACHLVARCSLTSSQFTISTGNRLTIQMAAAGILTASRA